MSSVKPSFENTSTYTSDELLDYLLREIPVTNNNGARIQNSKRWLELQNKKKTLTLKKPVTPTPAASVSVGPPDVFSSAQLAPMVVGPPNSTTAAAGTAAAGTATTAAGTSNQSAFPSVVPNMTPVQGIAIGTRRRPIPMISFRGGGEIPDAAVVTVQTDPYSVPTMMNYGMFQDMKNAINSRVGGKRKSKKSKKSMRKSRKH